jgi:hypothetical protein
VMAARGIFSEESGTKETDRLVLCSWDARSELPPSVLENWVYGWEENEAQRKTEEQYGIQSTKSRVWRRIVVVNVLVSSHQPQHQSSWLCSRPGT